MRAYDPELAKLEKEVMPWVCVDPETGFLN